jgi:hypothetical protein
VLPVIQLPLTRHGLLPPPAASSLPQAASSRVEFLPARHVSGRCLQQGESPVLGKVAVEGDGVGDTQARRDHEAHGVAE